MPGVLLAFGFLLCAGCDVGSDKSDEGGYFVSGPYNVTAEALSTSSIRVSWSFSGTASYRVYRSFNYNGAYTRIGSETTSPTYTDTGLTANTIYYYKVSAITSASAGERQSSAVSATTNQAAVEPPPSEKVEGVYIGIISFAGDATDLTGGAPVLLDAAGKDSLISKLSSDYAISSQGGTALFYSVHKALANLKSGETRYPPNLDSVNMVTFTDGLDNGSTGMSAISPIEGRTFDSDAEYTAYLSGQIASLTIADKPVTAYSVGVRGSDVTDTAKFDSNLAQIASVGKSQSLTDFANLQTTFQSIADGLQITHTTSTAFTMKTTLLASGAKVRMTFDVTGASSTDAAASSKYIEGVISRTGTGESVAYTFDSITYAGGLGSDQGAGPISGVRDGAEVYFAFTGVEGYDPDADESKAKQWIMAPDATAWQVNSEYDVEGAIDERIETRSSIIYLVLDASTSLNATQIGQIRDAAAVFINSLYNQLNGMTSPSAPSGVTAAAQSSHRILVSWDSVSNASGYYIYRAASESGAYAKVASLFGTSFANTGLSADTAYYYKVSAYNSIAEGPQSLAVSATTNSSTNGSGSAPSTPSGVKATAPSSNPSGAILVSWNSVSNASGYYIYRAASESGLYTLVSSTTGTSYMDTGLSADTAYYYNVAAYNDFGRGEASSNVYRTTSGVAPSAPSGVTAAAQLEIFGFIRIGWSQVSNANGYKIYRATSGSGVYTLISSSSVTVSYYIDNTVSPGGATYYYRVSAYNSYGESPLSSSVSAKTLTVLSSSGEWHENTLSSGDVHVLYYKLVNIGGGQIPYRIYWEDYDYDESYGNIKVSARDREGTTLLNATDAGYDGEPIFPVSDGNYITIIVQGYDSSSSGFYRIKCVQ
jgi:fibronectin type 3 domain-containing protein